MRNVACGIVLMMLAAGCGSGRGLSSAVQSESPAKTIRAGDPEWIKTIRQGRDCESVDREAVEAWLAKNLDKKSTRKDVLEVFGKFHTARRPYDLDRPERDRTIVYEYQFWGGNRGYWTYLVFHFDTKTDLLIDSGLSYAICGYCPHVLAYDGRWRLEGKMLAGCVGSARKGADLLVLPRLEARQGRLLVTLSNPAPEIDYITQASLAGVALDDRQHLDVSVSGDLVVWRQQAEIPLAPPPAVNGVSELTVDIDPESEDDVLVLELRNTSAFEDEMRRVFLDGKPEDKKTTLTVSFQGGRSVEIKPVGTKFLRRVVVPLPRRTRSVTLRSPGDFWFTRRLWIGKEIKQKHPPMWRKPTNAQAIGLSPMESAVLKFSVRSDESSAKRMGYVLRIQGYYDFVKNRALPRRISR